ncbi:MAG TPA: MMPL family transporter, partial [Leptolinea sp.]
MSKLIKQGWVPVVLWLLILAVAAITMPDMGMLVREKGQVVVGDSYSSSIGSDILKKIDSASSENVKEVGIVLVYHNPNKLTDLDKLQIKVRLGLLDQMKDKYHIISISNLFTNEDLASSLTSKDNTTLLVPLTIDKANRSVSDIREEITGVMKVEGVNLFTTSADLVTEDFIRTTEKGIEKTEVITVVFIILVLLLIFRSPVTPFVTILSVGLSFFTSLNVVLQLVKYLNFPVSSFTKVFLILVLFGIGTDYTMLLLMRYKEELLRGVEKKAAVLTSFKTAGKTVFYSSLTILIGFTCLFFGQFCTYRSASAVAVGVAVLVVVLFTFVPGMMILLGKNLFWSPFKTEGHSDSKTWKRVSAFSVKYPGITLIITALICGLIFFYNNDLSYNNLKEVSKEYSSILGNDVVSAHFTGGQTMPVSIAIYRKIGLDNQNDLASLDSLTESIKSVKGI